MSKITIREVGTAESGFAITVSVDGVEHGVELRDPYSLEDESRLEWYFEEHLRFPFTDQVVARDIAHSIRTYGEELFSQLFSDRDSYVRYHDAMRAGIGSLSFEIIGSPEFHRLHWEALKDPQQSRPFSVESRMVRKNVKPVAYAIEPRYSPTLNILLVTARPFGGSDVGYRTIALPLVERLHQARVPTRVEILRPGTYEALHTHLEEVTATHGPGFYSIVHFDAHGALLTNEQLNEGVEANRYLFQLRYGRAALPTWEGVRAFLFFEGVHDGEADPVSAQEISALLTKHQVSAIVLNACESGKQVGASETSLGSRLMEAGAQTVLAMGYSVTVSAAAILMGELYTHILRGKPLSEAIRRSRLELYNRKQRSAHFSQIIDLEDWVLPIVYENQPITFRIRPFTPDEAREYYGLFEVAYEPPYTTYGFVGRDIDVLNVERRLLAKSNILLIRGMGGAGKTTFIHHLGKWWQTTHFVGQVLYFGWDREAWTVEQIIRQIAQRLYSKVEYFQIFEPLPFGSQMRLIAQKLCSERHLLVLDNLESITGTQMAIRNTLPQSDQEELRRFIARLYNGQTLVLLGSRASEDWLSPGTFEDNTYDLRGLSPDAASVLAEKILARHGVTQYSIDPDFGHLLRLLDGYPLALEVVLANLKQQSPTEVLDALRGGNIDLDSGSGHNKTENILSCIDYSHGRLSEEDQLLLLCLAPFSQVVNLKLSDSYIEQLRKHSALALIDFGRWDQAMSNSVDWGLMVPDPFLIGVYRLQPVLPYFLRTRLQAPGLEEVRAAIYTAFSRHYRSFAKVLISWGQSPVPDDRLKAQYLLDVEFENLNAALQVALEIGEPFLNFFSALCDHFEARQERQPVIQLANQVLDSVRANNDHQYDGRSSEVYAVMDSLSVQYIFLNRYADAEKLYRVAIKFLEQEVESPRKKAMLGAAWHQLGLAAAGQWKLDEAKEHYRKSIDIYTELGAVHLAASTYHELGSVALTEKKYSEAAELYQRELEIHINLDKKYEQAGAYYQLGTVAQEQGDWGNAKKYTQNSLAIYEEFGDEYHKAYVYNQLAYIACQEKQWKEAEKNFRASLSIFVAFKDLYRQATTYYRLGESAEQQQLLTSAETYYGKALEIGVRERYDDLVDMVLADFARLWREGRRQTTLTLVSEVLSLSPNDTVAVLDRKQS